MKKSQKTSYLENYKELSSHIWRRDPQSLRVLRPTGPNYRVGNFRFLKTNNNLSFLKNFEKITKNVISRKLLGFEQSYLEARFVTP